MTVTVANTPVKEFLSRAVTTALIAAVWSYHASAKALAGFTPFQSITSGSL